VTTHARLHSRTFNLARRQMQLTLTTMESASLLIRINMRRHLCQRIKLVESRKNKSILNSSMMEFSMNSVAFRVIQCTYRTKAQTTQAVPSQVTVTTRINSSSGHNRPVPPTICKAWNKATLEICNSIRWAMKPNTTTCLRTADNSSKLIALNKTCRCP
jgi:hypothetical protein